MGVEIERKFLVVGEAWRVGATATVYRQGYLSVDPERTVRVRLAGQEGTITVKGRSTGATRAEFEFPIPATDAARMLDDLALRPLVEKTRYRVQVGSHTWEVDAFDGANQGLVLAELELDREDEPFERPPWLGAEVTEDHRYKNSSLVNAPFTTW